mgnify:CR=1 FL=1
MNRGREGERKVLKRERAREMAREIKGDGKGDGKRERVRGRCGRGGKVRERRKDGGECEGGKEGERE